MSKRFLLATIVALLALCGVLYGSDDPRSLENRLVLPDWLVTSYPEAVDPADSEKIQPLIVNGQETNGQIYQGAVGLILTSLQGQAICTASLIDPEVLLTAGHCVYLKENYQVVMDATVNPGAVVVKSGANIMGYGSPEIAKAALVKKHEGWSGQLSYNGSNDDIAMIKLDRKITDIETFGIRDFPEEANQEPGFVVGYGITSSNAYDSGIHRWGNAKLLTKNLSSKIIEVGDPSGTCQGDSGGPFLTTQNGRLVVSGITSFGGQVCYADRDGWDTWVLQYRDWIINTVIEFTGHGLIEEDVCGTGEAECTVGETKDCFAADPRYASGKNAVCNQYCSWWDTTGCDPRCGDSFILSPEVCDGGSIDCMDAGNFLPGSTAICNATCDGYDTSNCTATVCGDTVKEGKEFCDSDIIECSKLDTSYDFNLKARCKTDCMEYDIADCENGTILCGNGVLEPGEECDDGNNENGDKCSYKCMEEVDPSAVCGNGIKELGEQCDDGNTVGGDGCSATCKKEATAAVCGNGTKEAGEECDDGNTANGDGCSAACLNEDPNAECGNGIKEAGEACDDGNLTPGDGCQPDCTVQTTCGDGVKEGSEQCDDGNQIPGDGCNPDCTLPTTGNEVCGNGILEAGEACDDGNLTPGDTCDPDCTLPGTKKPTGSSGGGCSLTIW